jgi:threonine synthase
MRYLSTNNNSPPATFREALFRGLAPDGGLYVPESIPRLPAAYFQSPQDLTLHSIGATVASLFIPEISPDLLPDIVEKAWGFDIPLRKLDEQVDMLELFHGPTLAFKDVGARFMAQTMSHFLQQEHRNITILVATSGDTGSAVAHGFFEAPNITVCVLYPSGKISRLQEHQMATLGRNIHALEVNGTFDDCQRLVKQALGDAEVRERREITTANSINVGRLIPQISYFVWGVVQARMDHGNNAGDPAVIVPSGNFGNLTAGAYARRMGTPIKGFVAATNINDVVPEYLSTGLLVSRSSIATYSNAMDVGDPSNLARLQRLYGGSLDSLRQEIRGLRITDEETVEEIRHTCKTTGTILDPHTAVGVAAARRLLDAGSISQPAIVTATAHPAKFPEVIRRATGIEVPLPEALHRALARPVQSTHLEARYEALKEYLVRIV